ncbi:MAG: MFS transporter [Candidatus Eremiobacteraeota bacterium]|nr:MFS transporter [Candidatus Eremiobacteraeota bacterium]
MRRLLADREFGFYFAARQCTVAAFAIESAAIFWQVYVLRHSAFDLGLIGLLLFVPALTLALPAGYVADRFDRKTVSAIGSVAEMLGLVLFVVLALLHTRAIAAYFSAVVLIGIAHTAGVAAKRSLLADIVRPGIFVRATALSQSTYQVIVVLAPALAGLLISANIVFAFALAALLYGAGALSFALLHPNAPQHTERPTWRSSLEGIRYIWRQKVVLGAISLDLFAVLFGGAAALLPIYATQILHVGPIGFGALRAASGVGAAVVAAGIAGRPLRNRLGMLLYWCVAGFGVATIVFGVSKLFWLSLLALAIAGGFDMVSMVIRNVVVQLGTPGEMRGRVTSVENVFIEASNELGAFESGTVAAWLGAEASVVLGGVGTLVVIALWAWWFPHLRRFDAPSA